MLPCINIRLIKKFIMKNYKLPHSNLEKNIELFDPIT